MWHAILDFMWAQGWCALLMVSFIGWGRMVFRYVAGNVSSIGLAASAGLALAVLTGGVLNLLQFVTAAMLIGFTTVGVILAGIEAASSRAELPPAEVSVIRSFWSGPSLWTRVALVCLIVLFAFRIASVTRLPKFFNTDDETYYLAIPVKMMDTHHFAADPYSERRVESSLGGTYFLECLVTSFLPLENVQMADRYLGLMLLLLVTLSLAKQLEISPLEAMITLIFGISLCPVDVNITFTVLPGALVLAIASVASADGLTRRPAVQALLVGLLAGTLCSIKSTFLPHAVLICLLIYFLQGFQKGWMFALRGWALALVGALLVMGPWMVAMRMESGTLLCPIFGHGDVTLFAQPVPVPFLTRLLHVLSGSDAYFLFLVLLICAQLLFLTRSTNSVIFLAVTVAVLLGTFAIGFATGGSGGDVRRYSSPMVLPILLLSFLLFSRERHVRPTWLPAYFLQACCIAVFLMMVKNHADKGQYSRMWLGIETAVTGRAMESPETVQEYAHIRAAMPNDGLILTTLQHPYLLNPLDEHIFLADWPGCAGLPPSWPIKANGEALAQYLLSHSIKYLAYSYADNAQLSECLMTSYDPTHSWSGVEFESYLLANKEYLELRHSRRTLYDDGKVLFWISQLERHPSPWVHPIHDC